MDKRDLEQLLSDVADGTVAPAVALTRIQTAPTADLGFAQLDLSRGVRQGAGEVVYGAGKPAEQIAAIIEALHDAGAIALSDDGRPVIDTACLVKALCEAAKLHMRVTAHCEDLFLAKKWVLHEGEVSEELSLPGVPAAAEDCGTAREIAAAAAYDVPVRSRSGRIAPDCGCTANIYVYSIRSLWRSIASATVPPSSTIDTMTQSEGTKKIGAPARDRGSGLRQ